jgi:hypothetical protein
MSTDLIQVGFEAIPFYGWLVEARENRNHVARGQARDSKY